MVPGVGVGLRGPIDST